MSPIDAMWRLHHVQDILTTRFRAGSIPYPIFSNIGHTIEKILHPLAFRHKTPNISGYIGSLPLNFLRSVWVLLIRSPLHHTLISIDIGGEIRCLVKDT